MNKEVIIIGAGATGLAAAIFLEARGFQPRIYEKRERAKITKALGINPVTLALLSGSGVSERFLANGWPARAMNLWQEGRRIYRGSFSDIPHPYPFLLIQPQFETEQIMEDYLAEKGILVNRSYELKTLSQQQDITTLVFSLDNGGEHHVETSGIVIGADGSRSKVREALNISFPGWEHPEDYKLYDVGLDTPLSLEEQHYHFFREGAMITLHIRDGVWRLGGSVKEPLDYLPPGTSAGHISWETTFRISERVAKTFSSGNVYLLGDAAHIHSPIGARGMNMCIEDASIFAELLHQGREREFTGLRRRKIKSAVGMLGKMTSSFAGNSFVGRTVRSNMKRFSFLFPVAVPKVKRFMLGLK